MPGLDDYGAIMRSGASLVPDYAEQEARKQMLGLQRQQLEQQTRQAQRQIDQEDAFQADLDDVLTNPTAEGYSRIIAKHPKFAQQAKSSYDTLQAGRQQADLQNMSEIYAAAANGRHDLAAQLMRRRIDADKAVDGVADPTDEAMFDALSSNDPVQQKAALGMMGLTLSSITGPDKFNVTLGALTEGTKDFTLGPGGRRYAADGSLIAEAPFAPRPLTVKDGETIVEYQPGGGDQPSGGAGGNHAPRGIRNNNPGNLRDGPFAKSQPGYKGADSDGFAIFESADQGVGAQTKLLGNRYLARGLDTPDKIIETYAPASENSAASRANYKAHIASRLGIGVSDPIGADKLPALATAMNEFENGGQGGGPRVIAKGADKKPAPAKASETRVLNGQVFVKVNGQWYRKAS